MKRGKILRMNKFQIVVLHCLPRNMQKTDSGYAYYSGYRFIGNSKD